MSELIDFLTSDGIIVLLFAGLVIFGGAYALYIAIMEEINHG